MRGRRGAGGGPWTRPGPPGFETVAVAVLVGYLVAGRSFAQIGVAPASVFIGELLLVAMVAYEPTRATLTAALRGLITPGPLHLLLWVYVAYLGYGFLQLVRGAAGGPPLEAAKLFSFNYLPLFIIGGIAVHATCPGALRRLSVVLPWANLVYLGVFFVALKGSSLRVPFSAAPSLTPGAGANLTIILMLCLDRPVTRRWPLLAANVFLLAFLQLRSSWLALLLGACVWAVLTRRVRGLLLALGLALLVLVTLAAADVEIPGAASRGGGVSVQGIAARSVAPFDEAFAARLSPEAENFAGTTEWRREWWDHIWAGVHENHQRELVGYGYGFLLSDLFPQLEQEAVRTPHNVFFFALGYTGWLGVVSFGGFQAVLLACLWRSYRRTGNPIGPALWVMGLTEGLFGNFYETPYNALPFYALLGLALAPVAGPLAEAAQAAVGRGRTRVVATPGLPLRLSAGTGTDVDGHGPVVRPRQRQVAGPVRAPRRRHEHVVHPQGQQPPQG